jgi:glutamate---cysteine ligase / carboxylate-amine ligase
MLTPVGCGPRREPVTPVAVGVEEEFHIVGLATRRLAAQAGSILEQLPVGRFTSEL